MTTLSRKGLTPAATARLARFGTIAMEGHIVPDAAATWGTLTEAAYRRIRIMLLHQELRPGERTSVAHLAAATGLGRAPVKSAIERLAVEGLLQVRGRSGTRVARLDDDDITNLFEMRRIYETAAAPLIAERMTDEQFQELAEAASTLTSSKSDGNDGESVADMVGFIDADVKFHRLSMACANNPYLLAHYASLNLHLLISHYLLIDRGFHAAERLREHEKIVAAIKDRDAEAIAAAMRAHADAVEAGIHSTMHQYGTLSVHGA
ncbi:MAG TPA: GntR family transcriptional regulator [Actinomycetes bacterium]|nr:GntR family transcriptional regulator [Actinomycetes bacterium]